MATEQQLTDNITITSGKSAKGAEDGLYDTTIVVSMGKTKTKTTYFKYMATFIKVEHGRKLTFKKDGGGDVDLFIGGKDMDGSTFIKGGPMDYGQYFEKEGTSFMVDLSDWANPVFPKGFIDVTDDINKDDVDNATFFADRVSSYAIYEGKAIEAPTFKSIVADSKFDGELKSVRYTTAEFLSKESNYFSSPKEIEVTPEDITPEGKVTSSGVAKGINDAFSDGFFSVHGKVKSVVGKNNRGASLIMSPPYKVGKNADQSDLNDRINNVIIEDIEVELDSPTPTWVVALGVVGIIAVVGTIFYLI